MSANDVKEHFVFPGNINLTVRETMFTKILRTLKNVANYPTLYQQLYVADTYTLIINLVYSLQADLQCRHYDFMTLCQRSCH